MEKTTSWSGQTRPPMPRCNGRWRGGRSSRMLLLQVVVGGLLLGAIYALFSSGLTLIWGMMNFINFAHGEFVMLGMYAAFVMVLWFHAGPLAFIPFAAFALVLVGLLVYFGMIRSVMRGP